MWDAIIRSPTYLILIYWNVLLLPYSTSQVVFTSSHNDIAVAGKKVLFLCTTQEPFNDTQDVIEIYFQNHLLVQYKEHHLKHIWPDRPESYYTTIAERNVSSNILFIMFINEVSEEDAGDYLCSMTLSGDVIQSAILSLKIFPAPTCFVPGIYYTTADQNGNMIVFVKEGVQLTLVCTVGSDTNVPVGLDWSRSDGLQIPPSDNGGIVRATFTTTLNTSGVVFTCTSHNESYANISEFCSIIVDVSPGTPDMTTEQYGHDTKMSSENSR